MRIRTYLRIPALVLLLLVPAACGDDDGTGLEDDLSLQETEAMLEALTETGSFSTLGLATAISGTGSVDVDVDQTVPCPGGGSLDVTGNVTGDVSQSGSVDLSVSVTHTHRGCTGTAENGMTFTFDGAPDLSTQLDVSVTQDGSLSLTGATTGTLGWSTGDREGVCVTDLAVDLSGSLTSVQGSISGTACGRSVDEIVDLDVG